MGVTSGIGHFFESIAEMIQGVIAFILHTFEFGIKSVVGVFRTFVDFVEGTLGFAFHNFFILGTLAAAVMGYMLYTQRQGTAPASRAIKKTQ